MTALASHYAPDPDALTPRERAIVEDDLGRLVDVEVGDLGSDDEAVDLPGHRRVVDLEPGRGDLDRVPRRGARARDPERDAEELELAVERGFREFARDAAHR